MTDQFFEKNLTANDTGQTGAHQAGIHIPKSQSDLISFLPELDKSVKNPDAWITCCDEEGQNWSFRFVYYNNKFFDEGGTRDEYRITHMTKFFKSIGAIEGDLFQISGQPATGRYRILVKKSDINTADTSGPIRLRGWRRLH